MGTLKTTAFIFTPVAYTVLQQYALKLLRTDCRRHESYRLRAHLTLTFISENVQKGLRHFYEDQEVITFRMSESGAVDATMVGSSGGNPKETFHTATSNITNL